VCIFRENFIKNGVSLWQCTYVPLVNWRGLSLEKRLLQNCCFTLLTVCQFSERFEQLYDMYTHELRVKETIVASILNEKDRDTLALHISEWIHEP
jgi:hypothetical protein